jgi:hypothetical protein
VAQFNSDAVSIYFIESVIGAHGGKLQHLVKGFV